MRAWLHDEVPFPKSRVNFISNYTGLLNTIYIMQSCVSQAMIIMRLMTFEDVNTRMDQPMKHDAHRGIQMTLNHI